MMDEACKKKLLWKTAWDKMEPMAPKVVLELRASRSLSRELAGEPLEED